MRLSGATTVTRQKPVAALVLTCLDPLLSRIRGCARCARHPTGARYEDLQVGSPSRGRRPRCRPGGRGRGGRPRSRWTSVVRGRAPRRGGIRGLRKDDASPDASPVPHGGASPVPHVRLPGRAFDGTHGWLLLGRPFVGRSAVRWTTGRRPCPAQCGAHPAGARTVAEASGAWCASAGSARRRAAPSRGRRRAVDRAAGGRAFDSRAADERPGRGPPARGVPVADRPSGRATALAVAAGRGRRRVAFRLPTGRRGGRPPWRWPPGGAVGRGVFRTGSDGGRGEPARRRYGAGPASGGRPVRGPAHGEPAARPGQFAAATRQAPLRVGVVTETAGRTCRGGAGAGLPSVFVRIEGLMLG